MDVELVGFESQQALALSRTLGLQIRKLDAARRRELRGVDVHTGNLDGAQRSLDPRNTLVTVGEPREVWFDGAMGFECQVEVRDRTLLMRVSLFLKDRITEPTRATIRRLVTRVVERKDQNLREAARALRAELEKNYPKDPIDVMVDETVACDYVIAER